MTLNVISGLTEWAIKETWSLRVSPSLLCLHCLLQHQTSCSCSAIIWISSQPVCDLMLGVISPIPPSSHCQFPSLNLAAFIHVFIQSFMLTDSEINTSSHLTAAAAAAAASSCSYTFVWFPFFVCLFVCCYFFFSHPSPDAIAPRRMGDTVITDVIRRALYSPRQQKTRSPMWLLPQG